MLSNGREYSQRHVRRQRQIEVHNQVRKLNPHPLPQHTSQDYIFQSLPSRDDESQVSTVEYLYTVPLYQRSSYHAEESESIIKEDESNLQYNTSSDNEAKFDEDSLKDFIAMWTLEHKVSHGAVSELLKHLQNYEPFSTLPRDVRTLLQTPRQTHVKAVPPGLYVHFGLKSNLERILTISEFRVIDRCIKLQFNIDGLPIFKSTGEQFWPILCYVVSSLMPPFVIGLYTGKSKPNSFNEFLRQFVTELVELTSNGFNFNGDIYSVHIECFCCDAPARAYITCIKNHNAYHGCGKCTCKGTYIENRVVLLETDSSKRTNSTFRNKEHPDHHTGTTELERLNFNLVDGFPFEPMHLVNLGVTRKLLNLWIKSKPAVYKISNKQSDLISTSLCAFVAFVPKEFARRPRGLRELDRWKATEFRQFLLYTGPVVLKGILKPEIYNNFLTLHVAIRLLSSKDLYLKYNDYANKLLVYFIHEYRKIYGDWNVSYNIHGLCHLAEDSKILGSLESFSGYRFENFLGYLKTLLKKPNYPLQQIHRRVEEAASFKKSSKLKPGRKPSFILLPQGVFPPQFRSYIFCGMELKNTTGDNVCMLEDKSVVVIECFARDAANTEVLVGRKYLQKGPFFSHPCNSQQIDIYQVSKLSSLAFWNTSKIVVQMEEIYAVVHFLKTDEVALVPTKWINEDGSEELTSCYWPLFVKQSKIDSAVKNLISPVKSEWPLHDIRVFQTFDSYAIGLKKVPYYEIHSELSGNETPASKTVKSKLTTRGGRVVTRPLKFDESSSEEDVGNISKKFCLGPNIPPPEFPSHILECTSESNSETIIRELQEEPLIPMNDSSVLSIRNLKSSPSGYFNGTFPTKFKEFQTDLFLKLSTIETNQNTMLKAISSLVNNARVNNTIHDPHVQNQPDFKLPFTTKESLIDFDVKIKSDRAYRQAAVRYLASLGGSDLMSTVYEVLKKLMSYRLAYCYNYTGVNGKLNFSSLCINDLIFDVVKANPKTCNETMVAVRDKIKSWVQHAGDKLTKAERQSLCLQTSASNDSV